MVSLLACAVLAWVLANRPAENSLVESVQRGDRVLFIGAHPDDELTVAAFLTRAAETAEVMVLCLTRGEGGRDRSGLNLGDSIGEIRSEELKRSCDILGVDVRILGFSNGAAPEIKAKIRAREIPRETPADVIDRWNASGRDPLAEIRTIIDDFDPNIVLSFDAKQGFSNHPEHCAAAVLAIEAVSDHHRHYAVINRFPTLRNSRIPVIDPSTISETVDGREFSESSGKTYAETAFDALAEHVSQFGGNFMTPEKRELYERELQEQAFVRLQ